jgi:hypothetical protein
VILSLSWGKSLCFFKDWVMTVSVDVVLDTLCRHWCKKGIFVSSCLASSEIALLTSCNSVSAVVAAVVLMVVCFHTCLAGPADGLESSPCLSALLQELLKMKLSSGKVQAWK